MSVAALARRPAARPAAVLAAALILVYLIAQSSGYNQHLFLLCASFGALALSLNIASGFAGLFSLGHGGLFAVGAYTTAVAAEKAPDVSIFVFLPAAIVLTAAVGFVLGVLSLRFSSLHFAIITLVFAFVLTVIVQRWSLTGGAQGLLGPLAPGLPSWLSWAGDALAWYAFAIVAVATVVSYWLSRSPLHAVLATVRDSEPAARAAGVRVARVKIQTFTLSAGLAGMAGWLFSFSGFVGPGQFDWSASVNVLVMVVLGGIGTTIGPLLGAAFVELFPSVVHISAGWQQTLYGLLFIGVVVAFPPGFVGAGRWVRELVSRRSQPEPDQEISKLTDSPAPAAQPANGHGPNGDAAIACRGIDFRYGNGPRVLSGVDITIRPSTIHGLIGPNGSGKTTLVNALSGFLNPNAGTITISGAPVKGVAGRVEAGMRRTFQAVKVPSKLTCFENCVVGLYTQIPLLFLRAPIWPISPGHRAAEELVEQRCHEALEWAGIAAWAGRPAGSCPHAVQQLLQLAVAYVGEPEILVLDEPIAGLTPTEISLVAARLRALRARGVTILVIEHHIGFVFSICDAVSVLSAGELIADGEPKQIQQDPTVRAVYLGA